MALRPVGCESGDRSPWRRQSLKSNGSIASEAAEHSPAGLHPPGHLDFIDPVLLDCCLFDRDSVRLFKDAFPAEEIIES
jgi:hypothetical protein